MQIWRAALLALAFALASHAQESGISPDPADPDHPLPHDAVIRLIWSEVDHAGVIEMGGRKFAKLEDFLDPVRAKVAADGELRIVLNPVGRVPVEFGKQVADVLRQLGVTRIAVAMREWDVTLPVARDAKETPPPSGSQLAIRVMWSAADNTGTIEIEGRKFAKPEEIIETLQEQAKTKPNLRILVRADRTVRYDYLKQVLIAAGKAGVGKVTFSVVDNNPPATAQ